MGLALCLSILVGCRVTEKEPGAAISPPLKRRSVKPVVSASGRYVVFQSTARAIVPNDTNNAEDIFLYDRRTRRITGISVDSADRQGDADSYQSAISAKGRFIAFVSDAKNLSPRDTNQSEDIFVRDRRKNTTSVVSIDSAGRCGNRASRWPAISADGRYVAFVSMSDNLVPDDTNAAADVFVHDRETTITTWVSTATDGRQANAGSGEPAISADGRYVAFYSHATNLVPNDTNKQSDIFVHDTRSGETTRVSVNQSGGEGDRHSRRPSISTDGRYVAFESWADNLVTADANGCADIFVHDRQTEATTRVSVSNQGVEGHADSRDPRISADGRYVVFTSYADDLVSNDTNNQADVFVHDRQTSHTTRISVDSASRQGNRGSAEGSISADGRYVVFATKASNLVPDDTNSSVDVVIHDRRKARTIGVSVVPTRRR